MGEEPAKEGEERGAKRPNVFFGCLGEPTISKTSEEQLIEMLEQKQGAIEKYPLPPQIKAAVFKGARRAIHAAADAIPEDWFGCPERAEIIGEEHRFGEELISELKPKAESGDKAKQKRNTPKTSTSVSDGSLFSADDGGDDGNEDSPSSDD